MSISTISRFSHSAFGAVAIFLAALGAGLSGCSEIAANKEASYPSDSPFPTGSLKRQGRTDSYDSSSLFGGDGMTLFGGPDEKENAGAGIGVNGFLWRASLDTLSFMPLTSADPFGGVIITDWYQPPESQNERFKLTAYIMDTSLRADGVRIAVFRQIDQGGGNWMDAPVADKLASDLETAILTRARQMRIRTAGGG